MDDLVGRWFTIDGDCGIVRYVGPVSGTHGTWLGIEWAPPKHGKHNGTKSKRSYFSCSFSPTSGAFIRPVSRIIWGQSLLSAAHSRYSTDLSSIDFPQTIDGSRGQVSVPRLDIIAKFQTLEQLEILGLDTQCVFGTLKEDDLGVFARVHTLLLANNFFTKWTCVEEVVCQMPKVRVLDMSANPLYSPLLFGNKEVELHEIRVDNSPHISWSDVCCIAHTTRAHTLSHGWSARSDISSPLLLAHVRVLKLAYNNIRDIRPLGTLTCLEHLDVRGNAQLCDLHIECDTFHALTTLDLSETGVTDWPCVDTLNNIKKLHTLRIIHTPLLSGMAELAARAQLVARLPRVLKLDGSVVSADERTDMERSYLASCARSVTETNELVEKMARVFPRIHELVHTHGVPHVPHPVRTALDSRLAHTTLQVVNKDEVLSNTERPLIRTMLVRQLRPVAMRIARTKSFGLYISNPPHTNSWTLLDNEARSLSFYGVEDGSIIRIVKD
ncbi:hypothetical protein GGH17_002001 [Coemansia sp. RSA 788]|nr:hypothetical protein GGH17_002001 [Coemansia sp. RSA 788]KAJ2169666.1 hypothetical protein GGH15_000249 [Coemansia sp. RSA 562]KAJ2279834.1 hypothetical protein GGH14_002588 [Coemansia sp. RSA 370]KAJ2294442.1 hypothetical protein IW141_000283 [Coemansia sp. RSA 355]KAJ2408258.1 hypothetical protein J3F80_002228 [Coemansia sp. RSA 2526]